MSEPFRSLDRITIPNPCNADWESMIGNDQVRFCEHCNLHVTNLSGMTRHEAKRLVAQSQGRLCVRYVQNLSGSVVTKIVPEKIYHLSRSVSRIAAGAFTAALSLSNAAAQTSSTSPADASREQAAIARTISSPETVSTLSGVVTDPNGALVPGATVTLSNKETNLGFTYRSGE